MSKVVYVTPNDRYSYSVRGKFIENYFQKKEWECVVVTSDFDHRTKTYYSDRRRGLKQLHVPSYKKNISVKRIWSHFIFAIKSLKEVKKEKPDIVYISTPPNLLMFVFSGLKKHMKTKVIFEVGDMWPETLPVSKKKKRLLFGLLWCWKQLRDRYINRADFVIYECDLFKEIIEKKVMVPKSKTIYMCKETVENTNNEKKIIESQIELVYVGSVNNIIDIDLIVNLTKSISKERHVKIHIIGDGEQRELFVDKLINSGAEVDFHGCVYDENVKHSIFQKCHFAINIMKETVCVGVTMKSIDYFEAGLPIINNIKGDTSKIVDEYNCGINVTNDISDVAKKICTYSTDSIIAMQQNSRSVYENKFSSSIFYSELEAVIKFLGA